MNYNAVRRCFYCHKTAQEASLWTCSRCSWFSWCIVSKHDPTPIHSSFKPPCLDLTGLIYAGQADTRYWIQEPTLPIQLFLWAFKFNDAKAFDLSMGAMKKVVVSARIPPLGAKDSYYWIEIALFLIVGFLNKGE